jgi:hypothetical protein
MARSPAPETRRLTATVYRIVPLGLLTTYLSPEPISSEDGVAVVFSLCHRVLNGML